MAQSPTKHVTAFERDMVKSENKRIEQAEKFHANLDGGVKELKETLDEKKERLNEELDKKFE